MIPTSITQLSEIYVAVFLAAIFVLWVAYKMVGRSNETRHQRLRCSVCGMEFEDLSTTLLPRCTRCGSLNERQSFTTRYY